MFIVGLRYGLLVPALAADVFRLFLITFGAKTFGGTSTLETIGKSPKTCSSVCGSWFLDAKSVEVEVQAHVLRALMAWITRPHQHCGR